MPRPCGSRCITLSPAAMRGLRLIAWTRNTSLAAVVAAWVAELPEPKEQG